MNTRLEKILNKLEKMMFGAEVYNDDFNGTYIGNLLCLGDVRAALEDYINDGWIPVEERLPGVVVPYNTDGKIRCSKAQILEAVE